MMVLFMVCFTTLSVSRLYRMSGWKVSKIKLLYLRKHLLYTFMGYTIKKIN
jgi:hypothetical protein